MYIIMTPRAEFPLWESLWAPLGMAQGKAPHVCREGNQKARRGKMSKKGGKVHLGGSVS